MTDEEARLDKIEKMKLILKDDDSRIIHLPRDDNFPQPLRLCDIHTSEGDLWSR